MGAGAESVARSRHANLPLAVVLTEELGDRLTAVVARSLSPEATSNEAARAVLAIDALPGRRPHDLAGVLGVRPAALSRTLRKLEEAALVRRLPSPLDGRSVVLHLTTHGETAVRRLESDLAEELGRGDSLLVDLALALGPSGAVAAAPATALEVLDDISRMGTVLREDVGAAYTAAGTSVAHRSVLMAVFGELCDPRPSSIAQYLGRSRPSMTASLDDLEAAGLLTRRRGALPDGRAVSIELTGAGADLCRRALDALSAHAADQAACIHRARALVARRQDGPAAC